MEKYLPIGTVCLLKDTKKRVMIIGYCTIAESNKNEIFDYNGCLFPEGVISSDQTFLFNHDQIDKIYYMGYSDNEEKLFNNNLKEIINNIDQN